MLQVVADSVHAVVSGSRTTSDLSEAMRAGGRDGAPLQLLAREPAAANTLVVLTDPIPDCRTRRS